MLTEKKIVIWILLFLLCIGTAGCDFLYRILQKEGAEEKDMLGEILPVEPNAKVEEIQKLLKLYGYNPGTPDGKFGLNTRNAIEKFQKDNNLTVNRFVDRATWERLHVFDSTGLISDFRINVGRMQQALKNSGISPGALDGKMGRKTQVALKNFQKKENLSADGRVGFQTLSRLAQYLPEEIYGKK